MCLLTNSVRDPRQLSTFYCAIWLVDLWPIRILIKYRPFDCSVLRFPIENCSNKSTKSTSCFIFLFNILEITKIIKIKKKAMVGNSREICCSNWETRKSDEKLGDSRENRESWQVWVFGGTTGVYERIYRFKMKKNSERERCEFETDLRNIFCCRSYISNEDTIS